MASKLKNPSKNLNPNWAQLLEKLKSNGAKNHTSKHSRRPDTDTERSVLGKRKERSDEDSQASKPNPLIPTSSDCSLTDVVAMDCEMVGVSSQGNKSALGRVTLVNKWGNVIYDEFVRPVEYVVDFRTEISGIRPSDLRKAKNFTVVQKKVAELIKDRILVGHALRNDLKGRTASLLKNLASQFLTVDIQNGEHCPIEDARAAMLLYQRNRKQWERSIKDFTRLKEKQKKRKPKKNRRWRRIKQGNCGDSFGTMGSSIQNTPETIQMCNLRRLFFLFGLSAII
ncbi:UNVERIFIED_CONTAM: RNA exonuclease 4 [Sesamum angustifolium]|uniref:RNA exonuclease 4 n=1 Tax=Sesamum angustifolium TaxID=2727405 RepID=A0AAW2PGP2_9LAMI